MFYWLHPYYGKFRAKLPVLLIEIFSFFGGQVVPVVIAAVEKFPRAVSFRPVKYPYQLVWFQAIEPLI